MLIAVILLSIALIVSLIIIIYQHRKIKACAPFVRRCLDADIKKLEALTEDLEKLLSKSSVDE